MKNSRMLIILIVLSVIMFSSVGAALAHGGNKNLIHACVNKLTRAVRIVGATTKCKTGESALHWGIVGPTGPTGLTGPAGPAGLTGPAGPAGSVVMMARMNSIPHSFTTALTYGAPSGISVADQVENNVSMISPNATMTATALVVSLTVQVNNNSARRFTLRVNGADTTLTCTMVSFESSCMSTVLVSVPPLSLLSIQSDRPATFDTAATEARITFQLTQ